MSSHAHWDAKKVQRVTLQIMMTLNSIGLKLQLILKLMKEKCIKNSKQDSRTICVQGFSFASAWLEKYKQKTKRVHSNPRIFVEIYTTAVCRFIK